LKRSLKFEVKTFECDVDWDFGGSLHARCRNSGNMKLIKMKLEINYIQDLQVIHYMVKIAWDGCGGGAQRG
jgi:hypothetical protein